MKNPLNDLISGIYSKLNGNIGVPVYTRVSNAVTGNYVAISQPLFNQDNSKGCTGSEAFILLDIITEFPTNAGSFTTVNSICNLITNILVTNDKTQYPTSVNQLWNSIDLDNFTVDIEESDTKTIYRGLLRLRVRFQEL